MALTDSGSGRKVRIAAGLTPEQVGGFPLLLSGTVKEGDPLGYSSGWVRADANATIYPVYVAGADGVAGETIFGYLLALVEGYTAGVPGNAVYLSDTAGRVSESAGTNKVRVGTVVDTTKAILAPALWGAVSTDVLISLTTMLSDWRKAGDLTKIDGADISAGTIAAGAFAAGTIVNADISASAAIAFSKLATLASANLLVGSAGGVATSVAVTGDVTISNAGVTAISSDVIINADVKTDAAIAWSKMAALTDAHILVGSAGNVATDVAVSGDITLSNAGVVAIASGVIVNDDVNASAAIAWSKMAALTDAHILVGSAGNVATDVAVTGDVTISNAGVTAITADSIINADIKSDAAIARTKMASQASVLHPITLFLGRKSTGAAMLDETLADGELALVIGGTGASGIIGVTNSANNNTKTAIAMFVHVLPVEYPDGGALLIRVAGNHEAVAGGTTISGTVDVEVFALDGYGTPSADLVSTAAQNLTGTGADYDFTVDPTGLTHQAYLHIIVTLTCTEAGATGTARSKLTKFGVVHTEQG